MNDGTDPLISNTEQAYSLHPVNASFLPKARALVNRVFQHQSPLERLALPLFGRKGGWLYSALSRLLRADLLAFWLALRNDGEALGISGLYRLSKDPVDVLWLGWFGVMPESRGKGVGTALLAHAKQEALGRGARVLRLYTAESEFLPGSTEAQKLYEQHGFVVTREKLVPCGLLRREGRWVIIRVRKLWRECELR